MSTVEEDIFKDGSTTYYFSSKFFPKGIRDDIFKLYSFVRVVDGYVDQEEPDKESFEYIGKRWKTIKKNLGKEMKRVDDSVAERVLSNMAYIVHRYECDPKWVDAFLASMHMDLEGKNYQTLDDVLKYTYGSAEVIGLFVAKILRAPEKAQEFARLQGRAMQYINFIRDIDEDNEHGRCYFPKDDLVTFGLKDLSEHETSKKPGEFREFIEHQVGHYKEWQKEASKGYRYVPRRMRVAIKTAADMYNWTAAKIVDDPSIIFEKKVKPSRHRIVRRGIRRTLTG